MSPFSIYTMIIKSKLQLSSLIENMVSREVDKRNKHKIFQITD